jgi:hypothetical protein
MVIIVTIDLSFHVSYMRSFEVPIVQRLCNWHGHSDHDGHESHVRTNSLNKGHNYFYRKKDLMYSDFK